MDKVKQRFSGMNDCSNQASNCFLQMEYPDTTDGIAKQVNLTSLKMELNDLLEDSHTQPKRDSLWYSTERKGSTESVLDDMTRIETSVYSSVVSIPENYIKQKRSEKWKKSYIVRKMAGIPFAVLYGLFLYVLLRYMIYPERHENRSLKSLTHIKGDKMADVAAVGTFNMADISTSRSDDGPMTTISELRYNDHGNLPAAIVTLPNQSIHTEKSHNSYLHGEHLPEQIYASAMFSVTVGFVSIFSRGTRCTLLLILPCVITGRSRAILFTFITGLLVDGPISNLVHNFNEITRSTRCTYESLANLTKSSLYKLNIAVKNTKDIFGEREVDTAKPTFEHNFSFPKISAMNGRLSQMHYGITEGLKYVSMVRKALTVISMLLLIINAIHYLRSYYSDNSFDNVYISRNVRRAWKAKGLDDLIPLRHWEINEGYKVSSSAKCTERELVKIYRKLLPVLLFALFCVVVMVSDILLANVLHSTANEENIKVSFDGMEPELKKLMTSLMRTFNESVRACASKPHKTSQRSYIVISSLLVIPAISCVFEVYMSRIRAVMCNFFYTERAQERADYLHYRITAGRINRTVQSKLSIRRALERQNRVNEFFPWSRLKGQCGLTKTQDTFICPGCQWKVKCCEAEDICFTIGEITISDRICNDCCKNL